MESEPKHTFAQYTAENISPVFSTRETEHLHLYSLILSAADINHTVSREDGYIWRIDVASADRAHALAEIHAYDEENRHWPLRPPSEDTFQPYFRAQGILIVVSLALFYSVTGSWSPHSVWFSKGAVDSSRILHNGEYFRLLTALTLHADLVHLLGNCFLGGFLLHFYFRLLGNGIGLFALVLSATLANYINVIIHGPGHLSVGFSTAVFSVIGLFSALNYRHYGFTRPARLVLPLMAGFALLAMLGSSGERTDLGAHFFGLATGLVTGTILGIDILFNLRHNGWLQLLLTLTMLTLPVLAWSLAVN